MLLAATGGDGRVVRVAHVVRMAGPCMLCSEASYTFVSMYATETWALRCCGLQSRSTSVFVFELLLWEKNKGRVFSRCSPPEKLQCAPLFLLPPAERES